MLSFQPIKQRSYFLTSTHTNYAVAIIAITEETEIQVEIIAGGHGCDQYLLILTGIITPEISTGTSSQNG